MEREVALRGGQVQAKVLEGEGLVRAAVEVRLVCYLATTGEDY